MKTLKDYILDLEERLEKMEVAYNEMVNIVKDTNIKVNELKNMEFGNWEIKDNQMIFYDLDGNILTVFNLLDKYGNPTETHVYKREREDNASY